MLLGRAQEWRGAADHVDPTRILRVHKYRDLSKVRQIITDAAKKASDDALALCDISAKYIIKPIDCIDSEGLALKGGPCFSNPAFGRHLHGCDYLLAFVITIGPALDNRVIHLIDDAFEPLDALFLETAGWLTIETATRSFARDVKHTISQFGYGMSVRMGPGYEYALPDTGRRVRWNLEQQRELFEMFGDSELPVTLMESCAMQPKMSRSGVYGLRPPD